MEHYKVTEYVNKFRKIHPICEYAFYVFERYFLLWIIVIIFVFVYLFLF